MTASLDTSVNVVADVLCSELDGEAIILNLDTGTYVGLDPVATRIWQLCREHASLRAVFEALQVEFDAPTETLQGDLLEFVDEIAAKGLVTLR